MHNYVTIGTGLNEFGVRFPDTARFPPKERFAFMLYFNSITENTCSVTRFVYEDRQSESCVPHARFIRYLPHARLIYTKQAIQI
jgi:hypothetical protein